MRALEREYQGRKIRDCKSSLEKKLCWDTWYINLYDLRKDTLTLKKKTAFNEKLDVLNFICDGQIEILRRTNSGASILNDTRNPYKKEWSISNDTLSLKLPEMDGTFKITRMDTVLHLISQKKIFPKVNYTTSCHSYSIIPYEYENLPVISKLLPE